MLKITSPAKFGILALSLFLYQSESFAAKFVGIKCDATAWRVYKTGEAVEDGLTAGGEKKPSILFTTDEKVAKTGEILGMSGEQTFNYKDGYQLRVSIFSYTKQAEAHISVDYKLSVKRENAKEMLLTRVSTETKLSDFHKQSYIDIRNPLFSNAYTKAGIDESADAANRKMLQEAMVSGKVQLRDGIMNGAIVTCDPIRQ